MKKPRLPLTTLAFPITLALGAGCLHGHAIAYTRIKLLERLSETREGEWDGKSVRCKPNRDTDVAVKLACDKARVNFHATNPDFKGEMYTWVEAEGDVACVRASGNRPPKGSDTCPEASPIRNSDD